MLYKELDFKAEIQNEFKFAFLEGDDKIKINVLKNYRDPDLFEELIKFSSVYHDPPISVGLKLYDGENKMFEEISGDLITASLIALILIYIIMFIQFNNFVKPLIVYLTIPLSFTGSFMALIIFNCPITATSLIGMVSLIGVTVNTGILLVEYISRNHHNGSDVKYQKGKDDIADTKNTQSVLVISTSVRFI